MTETVTIHPLADLSGACRVGRLVVLAKVRSERGGYVVAVPPGFRTDATESDAAWCFDAARFAAAAGAHSVNGAAPLAEARA